MRTIIAITTIFNGIKSYVTKTHNRFKGSIAVELSNNRNEAKDFITKKEAENVLPNIYNPYEREYKVEELEAFQGPVIQTRTQSDLESRILR
jgi:hypothetical protein